MKEEFSREKIIGKFVAKTTAKQVAPRRLQLLIKMAR